MRINSWTKKLGAALVAGGLFVEAAPCSAADLGVNLVVDGGFEDINETTAEYGNRQLNSWTDGSIRGFTYASGQYDLGGPLAGGGSRYFTANGGDNASAAGQVAQRVDVSSGAVAAAIAAGSARLTASAFMTSYDARDVAQLQVDYLDSGDAVLASLVLADADPSTWTLNDTAGIVPVGASALLVSVYGIAGQGGPDGYLDNVSVVIDQIPEPTASGLACVAAASAGVLRRRRR